MLHSSSQPVERPIETHTKPYANLDTHGAPSRGHMTARRGSPTFSVVAFFSRRHVTRAGEARRAFRVVACFSRFARDCAHLLSSSPSTTPLSHNQTVGRQVAAAGTCHDEAEKGLVLSGYLLGGGALLLCALLIPISAVLRVHAPDPGRDDYQQARAGAQAAARTSGAGSGSTVLALRACMPCISRYVAWEISLSSMCTCSPARQSDRYMPRRLAGSCCKPARPPRPQTVAHLRQDANGLGCIEAVFHQLADRRVERLARIVKPCDDAASTREGGVHGTRMGAGGCVGLRMGDASAFGCTRRQTACSRQRTRPPSSARAGSSLTPRPRHPLHPSSVASFRDPICRAILYC